MFFLKKGTKVKICVGKDKGKDGEIIEINRSRYLAKVKGINMSKKELNGKVIKDQNNKTVVVLVKRRYAHPFFGKVITNSKKYHAHDEKNKFKEGDKVRIIESKPISKLKTWQVIEKWYRYKQNYR